MERREQSLNLCTTAPEVVHARVASLELWQGTDCYRIRLCICGTGAAAQIFLPDTGKPIREKLDSDLLWQ